MMTIQNDVCACISPNVVLVVRIVGDLVLRDRRMFALIVTEGCYVTSNVSIYLPLPQVTH